MRQICHNESQVGYTHAGVPTMSITLDVLRYDDNAK